ncbi:hypothetical protein B0H11DRAFT_2229118 [Mycena galericulata]|nr:hypothetical protein B0H11DRAFT_2229118 [Mycena galericulata]
MSTQRARKKQRIDRSVYVHDPRGEEISTASTATNARVRVERNPAPPPSPEKTRRTFDAFDQAMGYSPDDDGFLQPEAAEGPAGITVKAKKKKAPRNAESDRPMIPFIRLRNHMLDALISREGRGPWWSKGCMGEGCLEINCDYRCADCFGGRLLCRTCIVQRHRDEPLHIIEKWEDGYFQPCTLARIEPGLRYQIGHPPGEECDFRDGPHRFVILDNNAIHEINVDMCGCIGAPPVIDQLLNIGWFPATVKDPETCATLSLLRRFHTLNLQGRVPAYDFYNSLEVLSDRAGMRDVPDRREQFTLMAREYRHLQMCKRAGRGHDGAGVPRAPGSAELVYGIDATQPGELTIPCRACPIPGVNLPDGWEDAPLDKAWIYQLLLSKDANFKMKGRDTSSREKDPTLGPGFAYMVANDAYLKHLAKYVEEDEISHCVAFAALWRANNKRAKGLRATGIGSVSCSRHELFRPNGTGDLQKGERYSNMDYLFFSSIMGITLLSIVASYDIACQWFRNFWERMKAMPAHLRLPPGIKVQFKVPKFHLPCHVKKCHGPFSFNYTKWVGRTDGEGVERNWSWLNMIARSISVMGPGSRDDTIDDFCGYANWRKTVAFGNSLLRKMVLHIPKAILHGRAFHAFTEGLREKHEDELIQWETEVRAWEQDHEKRCPYEYPEDDELSMDQIRLQIAQEEHARVEKGASNTNSPGGFIMAGLEIEEKQESIRLEAKRRNRTSVQATDLQRKRTLLLGLIQRLRDEQAHYMPGLATRLEGRPSESSARPEDMKLYLPSSWTAEVNAEICIEGLAAEEDRLREAQAREALRDLRRHLRTRMLAHQFKRRPSGQAAYTKSQELHSGIEVRVKGAASRYRAARTALLGLRGPGGWEEVFQVLEMTDIRGMNERSLNEEEKEEERKARLLAGLRPDEQDIDEFGDASRTDAAAGDTTADGRLHDDIRIEWTKARARADRWREDLILLEEEMRRVLQFCDWKANWWAERRRPRPEVSAELAEGLCAYATEQAARERFWKVAWENKWRGVRARAAVALSKEAGDVTEEVHLEVELEEEVAYGEYEDGAGEVYNELD